MALKLSSLNKGLILSYDLKSQYFSGGEIKNITPGLFTLTNNNATIGDEYITFDALTEYIYLMSAADITRFLTFFPNNVFSYLLTFKIDSLGTGQDYCYIFHVQSADGSKILHFSWWDWTGAIEGLFAGCSSGHPTANKLDTSKIITTGSWYTVYCEGNWNDPAIEKIYIDNVETGESFNAGMFGTYNGFIHFGDISNKTFNGNIAYCRVWNRHLTTNERNKAFEIYSMS